MEPRMLGSRNAAFWNGKGYFTSAVVNQWMREMSPGLIRLPGGSYADHIYWNGDRVRGADGKVDATKMKDGYPDVNYADGVYETSFTAAAKTHVPGQSRAQSVDVKTMYEFVKVIPGASPLIIANAGTGRPVDAAEWVRWAKLKMGYGVTYCEVGNELDGYWMPIGSVKLADLKDGAWHPQTITVTAEGMIKAMDGIYNLWFVLGSSKPVKGSIYFDQIGLVAR